MSIIKVPAKLVEEIKFLKDKEVYDGEIEGICTAFAYVTDKMLNDTPDEFNASFSCLLSLRSRRNLLDLLYHSEIIEE